MKAEKVYYVYHHVFSIYQQLSLYFLYKDPEKKKKTNLRNSINTSTKYQLADYY